MTFSFHEKKKAGSLGEEIFFNALNGKLTIGDKLTHDFVSLENDKIELKTDFYDFDKTKNFFIERYSNYQTQALGGPWKSRLEGCKYFIYFFISHGIYYIFYVDKLVEYLDTIIDKQYLHNIQNQAWTTQGFKIKRELLANYYLERQIENYSKILEKYKERLSS